MMRLFGVGIALFVTGVGIGYISANTPNPFVWFQNDTKCENGECEVKLRPRKMVLEFIDREKFDKEFQFGQRSKALGFRVAGFSKIEKSPCEIFIPLDGLSIRYSPFVNGGFPIFKVVDSNFWNENVSETLTHEILHCYIGLWHALPEEVAFREEIDRKNRIREYREKDFVYFNLPQIHNRWDKEEHFTKVFVYRMTQ